MLTSALGGIAAPPEIDGRTFAFVWLLIVVTAAIVGLVPMSA
jgi:hypothetical protein